MPVYKNGNYIFKTLPAIHQVEIMVLFSLNGLCIIISLVMILSTVSRNLLSLLFAERVTNTLMYFIFVKASLACISLKAELQRCTVNALDEYSFKRI